MFSSRHALGGLGALTRSVSVHTPRHRAFPSLRAPLSSSSDASLASFADQNRTWVDLRAPSWAAPFLKLARVDRPVGTALVVLPAWAGLALASAPGTLPDASLLAVFAAGALAARGAGCTVNDMWDARFDARVARTRERPLASGRVSRAAAGAFLALQLACGAWCLLSLNWDSALATAAALPIVGLYPALKRVTHFPQLALGVAMNWGVLVAGAAVHGGASGGVLDGCEAALRRAVGGVGVGRGDAAAGDGGAAAPTHGAALRGVFAALAWLRAVAPSPLGPARTLPAPPAPPAPTPAPAPWLASLGATPRDAHAALALYGGCAAWTVVYDTIYAHQDRADDARLRLKSTALWLGPQRSRGALTGVAAAAAGAWAAAGALAGLAWPFYAGAGAAAAHVLWQVRTAQWDDRVNLTRRFVSNQWTGAALFAGVVGGRWLQRDEESVVS